MIFHLRERWRSMRAPQCPDCRQRMDYHEEGGAFYNPVFVCMWQSCDLYRIAIDA